MGDWPTRVASPSATGMLSTLTEGCAIPDIIYALNSSVGTAVWGNAGGAYFVPITIGFPLTIYRMAIQVGTSAAGNVDAGIYDYLGNQLVAAGPVAIGSSGVQVFNITDTPLNPGAYYLSAWCSTVTTATFLRASPGGQVIKSIGMMEQLGLGGLPSPATLSLGTGFVPVITASYAQGGIL